MEKKAKKSYQAPKAVKIGSFVKLTLGDDKQDTADQKKKYY